MEQILLCDSSDTDCAFGQTVGIHLRHDAFNPHINGECVNLAEAVEECALRNLFAHALDFYQLISAVIKGR